MLNKIIISKDIKWWQLKKLELQLDKFQNKSHFLISKFMEKNKVNKDTDLEFYVLTNGIRLLKFHMIKKFSKLQKNHYFLMSMKLIKRKSILDLFQMLIQMGLLYNSVTILKVFYLKTNLSLLEQKLMQKTLVKV